MPRYGRRRKAALALAGALFAGVGAEARADERDDQIRALREQLEQYARDQDELREEVRELRAERGPHGSELERVLEETAGLAGEGGEGGPTFEHRGTQRSAARRLQIGGYFSTLFRSSSAPGERSSFVDMRLVPQIHADISQNIAFDTEVEIEHGGVSDEVDGEIVVEYAELSFAFSREFTLKAGTLLVPFGHFNLNHDDPMNELSSRPSVARYISPSAFDLPGIGAEGALELSDDAVLTYDIALTNGLKDTFDSEHGTREARGLFEDDDNHDKTVFGRVSLVPQLEALDAFAFGVSGALGRLGEHGEHRLRGFGFDAQAKSGPWEFMGEYDAFTVDRDSGTAPPRNRTTGELGPIRGLSGYYLQALHRIRSEAVRALPFADENASVALVLRFDHVDLNDRVNAASPLDDERAWTVGVNYRPTSRTVVKLEYRRGHSPFPGREGRDRDLFVIEFATYF